MSVADILRAKGNWVATIRPEETVGTAVRRLRDEKIGALVVSESGTDIAGIISERDVVLGLADGGAGLLQRSVSDVMTRSVRTCQPDDETSELMAAMTEYRIRHLPVMVDGQLAGIISIGDVVKKRLGEVEFERDVMRNYVTAS